MYSKSKPSPISVQTIAKMRLRKYSPDQARDYHGRFSNGGGVESPMDASTKEEFLKRVAADPKYAEAIAENRARGSSMKDPGVLDSEGRYTQAAHDENVNIANSMLNPSSRVEYNKSPEAVLLIGKTGAGKSTLKASLGLSDKYTSIDADAIMEKLPGYRPNLAGAYHDRAADIAENYLLPQAVGQNMNLVLDVTGRSSGKMLDLADTLKECGYRLHVIHASVTDLEAGKRAYSRWKAGGRLVPLDYVVNNFGERPSNTFKLLKEYYANTAREYGTGTEKRLAKAADSLWQYSRQMGGQPAGRGQKSPPDEKIEKYSEDEPRDDHGRWTAGGGSTVADRESSRVVFEVAPNPDDFGAVSRWNQLSDDEKLIRSQKVAQEYVPKILAEQGLKGDIQQQIGSFQDDTNASFSLQLPEGTDPEDVVDATKALGYNLSQKSMMTVSDQPFPNASETDVIHIVSSKDFTLQSAKGVYDGLRSIKVGDDSAVGGQTTVGAHMMILNPDQYKVMDTGNLTEQIKTKLEAMPGDYTVYTTKMYSWFAESGTDYGNGKSDQSASRTASSGKSVQGNPRDFRDAITQAVTKALRWLKKGKSFREEIIQKVLKGAPRASLKNHPVRKSFDKLHAQYEPLVASAFQKVAQKIKRQIDMKSLAEAVERKNVHAVVNTVIGDKFAKLLTGEFRQQLFAAYHAGGVVGAEQLKNHPIQKGGPGSGRHPYGHSARETYFNILANQRATEGMRPAVRHYMSGEVVPARSGENEHLDIIHRLEDDGKDPGDYEHGFVTRGGKFLSRNAAESQIGRSYAIGKALTASLNVANPEAVDYLETHLPELIKEINDEQMLAIQKILLDGINNGMEGDEIAREIRDVVGLTEAQASWVSNFRYQLENGEDLNYTPVADRRLSATDSQMAQDEFDSPDTDISTVDYLVDKYAGSLLAKRAMDIAVTEIHNASVRGQSDLWDKAVDQGYLNPDITRRNWLYVDDDRVRDDHVAVADMNPDGVGLDENFQTPWGEAFEPGDGPDEEAINCRCTLWLSFTDAYGSGNSESEETEGDEDAESEEE